MFIDKLYLPKIKSITEIDKDEIAELRIENEVKKFRDVYFIDKINFEEEIPLYKMNILYFSAFLSAIKRKKFLYIIIEKEKKDDEEIYGMVIGSSILSNETHNIFKGNKEALKKRIFLLKNIIEAYNFEDFIIFNKNLKNKEIKELFENIKYQKGSSILFNLWFMFFQPLKEKYIWKFTPPILAILFYFGINYYFTSNLEESNLQKSIETKNIKKQIRKKYKSLQIQNDRMQRILKNEQRELKIKQRGEIYYDE